MATDLLFSTRLSLHVRFVLFVLFTFLSFNLHAQYKAEDFRVALLEAEYGAMIVFNGQINSFSLKVEDKAVRRTNKPNFMSADSLLFQSIVIPFQEQRDFAGLTADEKKDLLLNYRLFEKEYVEEELHIKLKETVEFIDINNQPFLYWSFKMPQEDTSVSQQAYLITICFDQIVVLNGPVPKGKTAAPLKALFLKIAQTLDLNPGKTYDVDKLFYDLRPDSLAPPFMLPIPEGWSTEIMAFPIGFAPKIPFTGEAHLRYAPAWDKPGSDDLWTYAFIWWINDDAVISQPAIESYLWEYYNGVVSNNVISRQIDPTRMVPILVSCKEQKPTPGDKMTFAGTVKMLDYLSIKPITLNLTIHAIACAKEKKTGVLILVSPQPATHALWKTLKTLRHDFQCSNTSGKQ
jgi:hypothetical protein